MKFVFAPDSFKGSLSAERVCALLAQAAAVHFPQAEIDALPVADGGEGTVSALVQAIGGRVETVRVTGPMGTPVEAAYGVLPDGTAVLEMAQSSGLPLVPPEARDPMRATSYGLGEMIAHVLARGWRRLYIGLGGSATNDGGMGMLCALGARFTDEDGAPLEGCGAALSRVHAVVLEGLMPALGEAAITVLNDVDNPLLGARGATQVYGPQKGATEAVFSRLEAGMARYADVLERALGRPVRDMPGAGAAGGVGAALGGVLGADMRPGIAAVLDLAGFDGRIQGASLVVTGEGRLDGQSIRFGKVVAGVAKRCAAQAVPVVAVVGGMGGGAEGLYDLAASSIMTTVSAPMDVQAAMADAERLLLSAADRMFRMLKIGQSL